MNTITIMDLRRLLERALLHADNEAIRRLPGDGRTVAGLAGAYLPYGVRVIVTIAAGRSWAEQTYTQTASLVAWLAEPSEQSVLDLTDPGTAHALLVALALALGLDPGEGALGVRWRRRVDHLRWELTALDDGVVVFTTDTASTERHHRRHAVEVAAEPHPVRALVLAVRRVLGAR